MKIIFIRPNRLIGDSSINRFYVGNTRLSPHKTNSYLFFRFNQCLVISNLFPTNTRCYPLEKLCSLQQVG